MTPKVSFDGLKDVYEKTQIRVGRNSKQRFVKGTGRVSKYRLFLNNEHPFDIEWLLMVVMMEIVIVIRWLSCVGDDFDGDTMVVGGGHSCINYNHIILYIYIYKHCILMYINIIYFIYK